jgi:hypothetical protein
MLELFEKLARRIKPYRMLIVLIFIAVCAAAIWVFLMASTELQDRWLIPIILALVWVLLVYSGLLLFAQVPAADAKAKRWRDRLSVTIKRGGYHLFAWFMVFVSAAVVIVTFQLSMAWIRML